MPELRPIPFCELPNDGHEKRTQRLSRATAEIRAAPFLTRRLQNRDRKGAASIPFLAQLGTSLNAVHLRGNPKLSMSQAPNSEVLESFSETPTTRSCGSHPRGRSAQPVKATPRWRGIRARPFSGRSLSSTDRPQDFHE